MVGYLEKDVDDKVLKDLGDFLKNASEEFELYIDGCDFVNNIIHFDFYFEGREDTESGSEPFYGNYQIEYDLDTERFTSVVYEQG